MKRILVMSYPYNHGQYQDDFSTPSTPQYPQWEVLEPQQHQDPQQLEADLLTPTSQHQANTPQQLYHTPAHLEASEHFTTAQPSPVEAPPALLHRHSHEAPEASTSTWQRTSAHPSSSQALSGHAPLRRSPTARSKNRTNPYPRPQSTGQISAGPALTRVYRVGERESSGVRFAAPPISTSVSSESSSTAPTNAPGPIVSFGSTASGMSPYTPTIMLPPNTPTFPTTNTSGVQQLQRQRLHDQVPARGQEALLRPRRYIIRSDIQYDPRTHVLTASMELPGVNKSQLTITLSTCLINRIKQVIVLAHASPVFPPSLAIGGAAAGSSSAGGAMDGSRATAGSGDAGGGNEGTSHYQVRERRYGEFSRTFVVPAETKLEDIDAAMADGLLTLKIACGPPAESANVQVVPIR